MNHPNHLARYAHSLAGDGVAEDSALAVCTDDDNGVPRPGEAFHLSGSAGHIQHGEGKVYIHVVRKLGIDAAAEKDGLAFDLHLVFFQKDSFDLVDLEGGEGEGNHSGYGVADLDLVFHLKVGPQGSHFADEHSAGACVLILMFSGAVGKFDRVFREGFFQVFVPLGD